MDYTLEEIYLLVGREDKTASVHFKYNSDSYKAYGSYVTVVFEYTQKEREALDKLVESKPFKENGFVKAKYLGFDKPTAYVSKLREEGINSEDITSIEYFIHSKPNTFHSKETRQIKTLNIKTTSLPNGRDLDWMYGFKKKLVKDGVGLCPQERQFYLAGKYYYEPDELTEDEVKEIYAEGLQLKEEVEWEFLGIKYMREEIDTDEKKRLGALLSKKHKTSFALLDKYLIEAGSSMKKLAETNMDKAAELYERVIHFKDKRIGVGGAKAVYIDIDGFLHIYMRHVEEMKVSEHFEHKDNFQWKEEDVFTVIKNVIEEVSHEIQTHFKDNPGKRYSRFGIQSVYFEGDYYTFHIEPDGRISTFHKNKKNIAE